MFLEKKNKRKKIRVALLFSFKLILHLTCCYHTLISFSFQSGSSVTIYANLCLHYIRADDFWLKCGFVGNLFYYLLWEVILSTITNSWARKKNILCSQHQFSLSFGYIYKKNHKKNLFFILYQPNFQDISLYDKESSPFGASCVKLNSWRPLTFWSCLLYDNLCKLYA